MSTEQHESYPPIPPAAPQGYPASQNYAEPQGYAAPQAYGAPQGYAAPQAYAAPQNFAAPVPPGYGYPGQRPGNGLGIAGFVTGLVSLLLCWVPWFGLLLGLVGVVLSAVGIAQGKKNGSGIGLAVAGLVCAILALVVQLFFLIALVTVASSFGP